MNVETQINKKRKRKIIIAIFILIPVVLLGVAVVIFFGKDKTPSADGVCYVEEVSVITGSGITWQNRYMGIVESQEITKVQKDSDKTVKEIFVKEEDIVKEGDKLFSYDTEEMTLKLRQLELELTSIYNNVNTMYDQIETLSEERELAPAENKIEYTSQIQNLQAQINQASYDANAKQLEIDRQNTAINNAIVYAPVGGVINSINNQDNSSGNEYGYEYDMYGMEGNNDTGFISIMAMGDYRIKGTVSELNAYDLYEGMPMILRSRINEEMTWTGVISLVDLEHPVSDDSNYYYTPGETATKYPFYIQLDSSEGLMLGQHLYIEFDNGQGAVKDGLWLYDGYIVFDGNSAFVWVEKEGKLEKRDVELGEYDTDMMEYEILSGITTSDYIAFPEDRLEEGMKTTHNYDDVVIPEGGALDGEIPEDVYIDDGYIEEIPVDDVEGDSASTSEGE